MDDIEKYELQQISIHSVMNLANYLWTHKIKCENKNFFKSSPEKRSYLEREIIINDEETFVCQVCGKEKKQYKYGIQKHCSWKCRNIGRKGIKYNKGGKT